MVAVLDTTVMYDIDAKLDKLVNILAQSAGVRFGDAAALQVCGDVRKGGRVLLIGSLP